MCDWMKYDIEIGGIIKTVESVCNDYFVLGYTEYLKKAIKEQNSELTNLLTEKLLDWYDTNIEKIMNSDFIYNKNNQEMTIKVLKELNFYTKQFT